MIRQSFFQRLIGYFKFYLILAIIVSVIIFIYDRTHDNDDVLNEKGLCYLRIGGLDTEAFLTRDLHSTIRLLSYYDHLINDSSFSASTKGFLKINLYQKVEIVDYSKDSSIIKVKYLNPGWDSTYADNYKYIDGYVPDFVIHRY